MGVIVSFSNTPDLLVNAGILTIELMVFVYNRLLYQIDKRLLAPFLMLAIKKPCFYILLRVKEINIWVEPRFSWFGRMQGDLRFRIGSTTDTCERPSADICSVLWLVGVDLANAFNSSCLLTKLQYPI